MPLSRRRLWLPGLNPTNHPQQTLQVPTVIHKTSCSAERDLPKTSTDDEHVPIDRCIFQTIVTPVQPPKQASSELSRELFPATSFSSAPSSSPITSSSSAISSSSLLSTSSTIGSFSPATSFLYLQQPTNTSFGERPFARPTSCNNMLSRPLSRSNTPSFRSTNPFFQRLSFQQRIFFYQYSAFLPSNQRLGLLFTYAWAIFARHSATNIGQ